MKRSSTALRSVQEDSGVRPMPRAPRAPKPAPGVVDQVRAALKPQNRIATLVGFMLGGFVPVATFVTAHSGSWTALSVALVVGGLLYSARTVYSWGVLAFAERVKALGFVMLLEGVLVTSQTAWLARAALAYLVLINGTATACQLSRKS